MDVPYSPVLRNRKIRLTDRASSFALCKNRSHYLRIANSEITTNIFGLFPNFSLYNDIIGLPC